MNITRFLFQDWVLWVGSTEEQGEGWAAQIDPAMQEVTWKLAERVYSQTTAKASEKGWPQAYSACVWQEGTSRAK